MLPECSNTYVNLKLFYSLSIQCSILFRLFLSLLEFFIFLSAIQQNCVFLVIYKSVQILYYLNWISRIQTIYFLFGWKLKYLVAVLVYYIYLVFSAETSEISYEIYGESSQFSTSVGFLIFLSFFLLVTRDQKISKQEILSLESKWKPILMPSLKLK